MANNINCTCGHSWSKASSSKKDMNVCHICGKDNTMRDGGWLNKFEQGGMVLKQKTQDNYGKKDNPNNPDVSLPPGFKGLAYNTKGRNYSPAWGGQFQMGGSLPGAVGFTYARTAGAAPTNGPYAKKTKASAQNGKEMKFYQEGLDWKPRNISRDGGWLSKYEDDIPEAQDGTYVKQPRTDMLTMDEYRLKKALANQPVIQSPKGKQLTKKQILAKNQQYAEERGKRFDPNTGAVTPFLSPSTARTFERASEKIVEPMISLSPVGEIGMVGDLAKGVKKYITAKASKQKLSSFDKDMKEAFRQIEEESSKITKPKAPDPRIPSREELKKYFQKLDEDNRFEKRVLELTSHWTKEPERTFGSMTADRIEAENYLRNFPKETRKQSDQLKQMFDTYHEDVNILKKSPEEADPSGIIRDLKNNPENVWNMYDLMSPEETRKMLPVTLRGGTEYINQNLTGGGRQLLGDRGEGIFKKKADDFGKYEQAKPWQIFNKEFFMRKNENGGVTKDDNGYWNPENWGEPVEIGSNEITMQGVYEPLIGVSDTGDTQMMYPGEDYIFDGESVTEYPVAQKGISVNKADEYPIEKLDQSLNFTNYNKPTKGGWLDKWAD